MRLESPSPQPRRAAGVWTVAPSGKELSRRPCAEELATICFCVSPVIDGRKPSGGPALGLLFASALVLLLAQVAGAVYSPDEVPILYVPFSARASALGNALYCSPEEGCRNNPAFLAALGQSSFSGTYGLFRQGSAFGTASLRVKGAGTGWAAGLSDISAGFDRYDSPDSGAAGSVSVSQSLVSLAAGMRGSDENFLLGGAVRVIIDAVAGSASYGYSLDLGGGYVFDPRVQAGLVLRNALSLAGSREDRVLQETVLAAAARPRLRLGGQDNDLANTISLALFRWGNDAPRLSLGWESVFHGRFAVRAGLDRASPAAGVGFRAGGAAIDLAAAFKAQGFLYFMTFGWHFGTAPGGGQPPAEEKQAVPAKGKKAASKKPTAAELGSAEIASLMDEGWEYFRTQKMEAAIERFTAALSLEPGHKPAADGIRLARQEIEKARRKESARATIAQGWVALENDDYLAAEELFRSALGADPDNRRAKEGLRVTVETVARQIEGHLNDPSPDGPFSLGYDEARSFSDGGSFARLVAVLELLAQKKQYEAYGEWTQVQPREHAIVRKYAAVFDALPGREYEQILAKASELAAKGWYLAAVRELGRADGMAGLSAEQARKAKGYAASYEYVGREMSSNYLDAARGFIEQHQYRRAASYLEKAIRCGYDAAEAQKMLADVKGREDEQPPSPGKRGVTPPEAGGEKRKETGGTRGGAREAERKPPASSGTDNELLREYRNRAVGLFRQGRLDESKEYFLKILFVDPGDGEAKRYLTEIYRMQKSSGR